MIDTISITLPQDKFKIMDYEKFSPSARNFYEQPYYKLTGKAPIKAVLNPTKELTEKYGYLPRITLFKAVRRGSFPIFLKIEFSIPKLLHGNNFDEVVESDFGEICWLLKDKLYKMGVNVEDVKYLSLADVSTVHYSKNLILTDYTDPYTYLQELRKINVSKLQDTNQSDYRNEGHSFKFHSNDYEVIFYDKLKDLQQAKKSEKRAIESDNYVQLNLFEKYEPKQPFEVLRMEVRIGNRTKLKQILKKHGFEKLELNFNNLFSKEVSQKILLSVLKETEKAYPVILNGDKQTLAEFTAQFQVDNPKLNYSQLLKFIGAKALIENVGIREFRKLTNRFGDSQWYRLNKAMQELKLSNTFDVFDNLRKQLEESVQVKLEDYKLRM